MPYKVYKYPRFQKGINVVLFILFVVGALVAFIASMMNLIGRNDIGMQDMAGVLSTLVVGFGLVLIALTVNMLTPDIRVQNDGLQIQTAFYQSEWLQWEDIVFVKRHPLSTKRRKMHSIGIGAIHPIYSLVGLTQQMGGRGFVITQKIQGYDELMKIVEEHRPDLK